MRRHALLLTTLSLAGCPGRPIPPDAGPDAAIDDARFMFDTTDVPLADIAPGTPWCALGHDVAGTVIPADFCVREFIAPDQLHEPRVMAFAPNGDLFVSAPNQSTGASISNGPGDIVVLADDNRDGVAEKYVFAHVPDVHGIAFGPDALYFTTLTTVFRTDYAPGQRVENLASRTALGSFPTNRAQRWTHGLARTHSGVLIATQGVWGAFCPDDNTGTAYRVEGGSLVVQATGFRNPMYVRCHPTDEVCLLDELGDDSAVGLAREKVVTVRPNTFFGFPCCAYADHSLSGETIAACSAATVANEDAWFPLNDTPFGLDWERGAWPAPYRNALFIAKHGSYYSNPRFQGTSIVFAATDPVTHAPIGEFQTFASGFGESSPQIRRATDVTFANDGRLYFADDTGGGVYWIAPTSLTRP